MIWCVNSDAMARNLEVYALQSAGLAAKGFEDGASFWDALQTERPELVVLDAILAGADSMDFLRKIRESSVVGDLPVIMTSSQASEYDKILSLDLGADDYLIRPFGVLELVSRIKAVLRRYKPHGPAHLLKIGKLEMRLKEHTVIADGKQIRLAFKEFELLRLFMSHPGLVFTREQLCADIWGMDYSEKTRTVDVHIGTLRQKLGTCGDMIEGIRNVGYRIKKLP